MKTANITYYGEGPLNLQMRRFKPGKSVRARLDDILPDERRRYQDRFLVTGSDGLIINIGSMVPDDVAKLVIGENPQVLRVPGFDVRIPPGYALDDTGAEPRVVEAAVMAAKMTAVAVEDPPREAPNLTIVKDDPEPCGECGQVDVGQQGEYPCRKCGLPKEHDKEYEGAVVSMTDGLEKAIAKEIQEEPVGEVVLLPNEEGQIIEDGEIVGPVEVDGKPATLVDQDEDTFTVKTGGPSLNDEPPEPEEPEPAAAKKKKKPAKKKSKADSLLEEF